MPIEFLKLITKIVIQPFQQFPNNYLCAIPKNP